MKSVLTAATLSFSFALQACSPQNSSLEERVSEIMRTLDINETKQIDCDTKMAPDPCIDKAWEIAKKNNYPVRAYYNDKTDPRFYLVLQVPEKSWIVYRRPPPQIQKIQTLNV